MISQTFKQRQQNYIKKELIKEKELKPLKNIPALFFLPTLNLEKKVPYFSNSVTLTKFLKYSLPIFITSSIFYTYYNLLSFFEERCGHDIKYQKSYFILSLKIISYD